jgi:hemolysin activation/secretion protein
LLALSGISVGGVHTVRGYRENQLVRDIGEIVNIEFEYPVVRNLGPGLNVFLIPFYDHGRGRNNNEGPSTLSSWGLASRVRWHGFSFDVAVAKKMVHPELPPGRKRTLQDRGIHFQIAYNFF